MAIDAPISGGDVALVSAGTIASNSAGVITTIPLGGDSPALGVLSGSSVGGTTLNAANLIAFIDGFTNTGGGNVSLTDVGSPTIVGSGINAGSGTLTLIAAGDYGDSSIIIDAPVSGGNVDLVAQGQIEEGGGNGVYGNITTPGALSASTGGAINLDLANQITGDVSLSVGGNSDVSLFNEQSLTIVGSGLNAGAGIVNLETTGANHNLTLNAPISGGEVTLVSAGTVASNSNGVIAGYGGLYVDSVGGATLNAANQIQSFSATNTGGGNISLTNTTLLKIGTEDNGGVAISAGSGTLTLTTTGANSDISIYDSIFAGNVDLVSAGTITTASNAVGSGSITTTGTLYGSSVGGTTLNGANAIASLGPFTTGNNGSFTLTDSIPLTVSGAVNAGGGNVSLTTTGSSSNMAIDAAITGNTVNLTTGGNVTESSAGAITASLLNVTANTGISLTSTSNDITTIGTDTTNSGPNTIDQN